MRDFQREVMKQVVKENIAEEKRLQQWKDSPETTSSFQWRTTKK